MEGNFTQAVAAGMFCGFIILVCIWQLIATSLAKRRRIRREKAKAAGGGV